MMSKPHTGQASAGMAGTLQRGCPRLQEGWKGTDEEEYSGAAPPPLPTETKQCSQFILAMPRWHTADYRMKFDDRIYGELAQTLSY